MANKKDYFIWDDEKSKLNISCLRFDKEKDIVELHLRKLMEAIDNVKSEYATYALNGISIPPKYRTKGLIKHTERVFAYELYHQWSNIIDKRTWVINAEIRKYLECFKDNLMKKVKIVNDENPNNGTNGYDQNKVWNFPDLVLHKGQNKNYQMIACEIKRKDRLKYDFVKDIETLYWLTRSELIDNNSNDMDSLEPYRTGVFLLLNGNFEDLKSIVKESQKIFNEKKIELDKTKNIICVFYNRINNHNEIGFQSLFNINNLL